jgi:hypothetical protein
MKSSILLHCTSSLISKTISFYLENAFFITENPEDPSLKAIIFDTCPSSASLRTFHEKHPHVVIYLLLPPKAKIPTFSFPIKVLERPLSLKTLEAHLSEPVNQTTLTLNEFKLYLNNRRLIHPDVNKNYILTEKETEILAYLYKAYPLSISRDALLKDVWNYTEGVTTHTVETHIYKLKQKVVLSSGGNLLKTTEDGYSLNL